MRGSIGIVKSLSDQNKEAALGGHWMKMRAETHSLVEEIKQSLRLLRRHL
ncbi:MAG: hypothetical protein ACREB2_03460 [Pseudolabrys sp.]